jgi:hypothetical protein
MNLAEIIAEMEGHPSVVRVTQEDHVDHVFCRVVYEDEPDIVRDVAVNVIVKDRGLGGEEAYYEAKKPKPLQVDPDFKVDLDAKIVAVKGAQPDFKFHSISVIDNNEERAIVDTYWEDTGNLVLKQYGAWRKADDSIDFMEIV